MLIASGIEIMWPSTNGSIPAGWTRVTNMDSTYPKGTAAAVNPDVTGGAATHTHTDPGHTHTVQTHTHTNPQLDDMGSYPLTNRGTAGAAAAYNHGHYSGQVATGASSNQSGSTAASWVSGNSDPSYYDVIWISSNGTEQDFPANSWAFWDKTASLPTSWSNPAAARNVFPKGAAAAGNGGGTGGGSHTHSGGSHGHITNSHGHNGTTGVPNSTVSQSSGNADLSTSTHTHTYSLISGNTVGTVATSGVSGSTSYEPSFAKLAIVQNDSGVANIQVRHVAMWAGTLASIPTYWVLCDGTNSTVDMRGKFVKGANGVGEIGNTGGTAGHLHADAATHTHSDSHVHAANSPSDGESAFPESNDAYGSTPKNNSPMDQTALHVHDITTNSSTASAVTTGATAQTAPSTADTQPAFRTRAYIALITLPVGIQQALLIL